MRGCIIRPILFRGLKVLTHRADSAVDINIFLSMSHGLSIKLRNVDNAQNKKRMKFLPFSSLFSLNYGSW